jgi:uncharacterized protein (DUF1684 family)
MKACPVCAEQIQDAAIRCRFCGENLSGPTTPESTNTRSYTPKLRSVVLGILLFTLVFVTSGVFYTSHKKTEALKQKAVKLKQDQQNVLAQFSKLESSLTVGVNYADFGHYLQAQQIAIDQFNAEHKDEKDAEQFVQAVQGIQQFFKDSQKFWAVKFETDQYLRPDAQHYPDSIQSSYFKVQLEQYPELSLLKEEVLPFDNRGLSWDNPEQKYEVINVDSARQILWTKATSRLTEIRDWLRGDMKTPLPAPSTASEMNSSQSAPSSSPIPSASPIVKADEYGDSTQKWQRERDAELREPDGPLTFAGLFWLKPGANTFGSDSKCDMKLPRGPKQWGSMSLKGELLECKLLSNSAALQLDQMDANGTKVELKLSEGDYNYEYLGEGMVFWPIKRDGRWAIRLKDSKSPNLLNFKGMSYFLVDPQWQMTAKFEAFPAPRRIKAKSTLGTMEEEVYIGEVLLS